MADLAIMLEKKGVEKWVTSNGVGCSGGLWFAANATLTCSNVAFETLPHFLENKDLPDQHNQSDFLNFVHPVHTQFMGFWSGFLFPPPLKCVSFSAQPGRLVVTG